MDHTKVNTKKIAAAETAVALEVVKLIEEHNRNIMHTVQSKFYEKGIILTDAQVRQAVWNVIEKI